MPSGYKEKDGGTKMEPCGTFFRQRINVFFKCESATNEHKRFSPSCRSARMHNKHSLSTYFIKNTSEEQFVNLPAAQAQQLHADLMKKPITVATMILFFV